MARDGLQRGLQRAGRGDQPFVDRFVEQRLPKWLAHFGRKLAQNNDGGGGARGESGPLFFVGAALSYADLADVLDGVRAEAGAGGGCRRQYEALATPLLKRFVRQIESRPRVRAWLDNEGRCAFTQTGPGF